MTQLGWFEPGAATERDFAMTGILRLMIALAVLISAIYAIIWVWTGTLPDYGAEILGTLGIITVVSLAVLLLSKPTGGAPKP